MTGYPSHNGHASDGHIAPLEIVSLADFAAVDEPGADPLVGAPGSALIPEGADTLLYGDGGAAKTTLSIDLGCHVGAGREWLGIPVARCANVLIIENEGPRPLFREKMRRKIAVWGDPVGVSIFPEPWGELTFADEGWRNRLAATVDAHQIDVLIAGPVTRLGMDGPGTLAEIRDFMALITDVRKLSARRLTVILIHHEAKSGAVSGAWEGSGDTLLHVQAAGPGRTVVYIQKARWSSEHHGQTLKLAWTPGDGFEVETDAERDYLAEIVTLLGDGRWRSVDQIRVALNAGTEAVESVIKRDHASRFEMCTGKAAQAVGGHFNHKLYRLVEFPLSPEWEPVGTPLAGVAPGSSHSPLALKGVGMGTTGTPHGSDSAPDNEWEPDGQRPLDDVGPDPEPPLELTSDDDFERLKERIRELRGLPEDEAAQQWAELEAEQARTGVAP